MLEKLPTGITGFDLVSEGGLPRGRATLVAGTAGSAKTVFACQFLAGGMARGEPGVFVTFEETPEDIRYNVAGFGWPVAEWEAEGRWRFVDCSPDPEGSPTEVGEFDLSGLLARVRHAVRAVGATRVAIDSLSGVFGQFRDPLVVRRVMFQIIAAFKAAGVTAVITSERTDDQGSLSRFGIEEFVSDNVVLLRNSLELEKRRRTVEILKLRGASHQKGEYPFTVTSDGLVVLPLSAMELKQRSSLTRVSSGNGELDGMCGGGFFRDSIILVSGPTGTGKTLLTAHFVAGGAARGERCLLFAFEESRDQLFRNANGWGIDFSGYEREGLLRVSCAYPESRTLEDHLIALKSEIEAFKPDRVAVDSLTALERVSGEKTFREFVIAVTAFVKQQEIAGQFTATTASLLGGTSVTEAHISTITDSIILLRYVEVFGEMRRGVTVLKMRGSMHDKQIRELTIDGGGMHIGRPFRSVSGILSGTFVHQGGPGELERVAGLFSEPDGQSRAEPQPGP